MQGAGAAAARIISGMSAIPELSGNNPSEICGAIISYVFTEKCPREDTLIHGRKERPKVDSINDMNFGIIKEHIRQATDTLT
ncbi:hypothetical protein DUI87_07711 [Hirundo rustica rustica]|uniref:Uncharacterized protein n=1 Tax=Hirundo rustica rustica TaxID=333673 RepID=A0A3M0L8F0_HIRRU|nr:hypothetical protein DUI87_07711 [Hirundo rustica rustica]